MAILPNQLIGTRAPAPRQGEMLAASAESWAYWNERPYPQFAFGARQWPAEKGPLPTPLPYVQVLITEGAEFVFRNGAPQFSVPPEQAAGLEGADQWLRRVIETNCLAEQWIALAEHNGNQGALAVKFSVDLEDQERPVRLAFLDVPQQCRVWFDPHDCERMLLARIQYPYRDVASGDWYYYREEWTDDLYVTYVPRRAADRSVSGAEAIPGYLSDLGDSDDWQIDRQEPN
ncbi:MAG TPA: hypothetical protein VFU47_14780, partial [Armatimonadota bacterium]|nr:hypothetical protein [Armatimonadota bacterium]